MALKTLAVMSTAALFVVTTACIKTSPTRPSESASPSQGASVLPGPGVEDRRPLVRVGADRDVGGRAAHAQRQQRRPQRTQRAGLLSLRNFRHGRLRLAG